MSVVPTQFQHPMLDRIAKNFGSRSFRDYMQKNFRDTLLNEGGNYGRDGDVMSHLYQRRAKLTFAQREVLFQDCAYLNFAISKNVEEQYRKGLKVSKIYEKKCVECGAEYDTAVESCEIEIDGEVCGGETNSPNGADKIKLDKAMRKTVNRAKHHITDVGEEIAMYTQIHDYGVGICKFIYHQHHEDGVNELILDSKGRYIKNFQYFYRGDSSRIRPTLSLIYNPDSIKGTKYNIYLVCPVHRFSVDVITEHEIGVYHTCDVENCDMKLEIAEYVLMQTETSNEVVEAYLIDEVLTVKQHQPTQILGRSKIDAILYDCLFLIGNDRILSEYAMDKRLPKGYFIMNMTGNYENNKRIIDHEMEKFHLDPNYIPHFPVGKDGSVTFNKIDDAPLEIGWESKREESRKIVTATFGVNNMFANDPSSGSGLNNDGLQMAVTNRAIEKAHNTNDRKLWLPLSAAIIGKPVTEIGYKIVHELHEEADEMAELQREQLKTQNAISKQQLGSDIILDEKGEYVEVNPMPNQPLVPQQQGGMGGMPGMPGLPGIGGPESTSMDGLPQLGEGGGEPDPLNKILTQTLPIAQIEVPQGYKITESGIVEGEGFSETTQYFMENPGEMKDHPIDVYYDLSIGMYILMDGYHRLTAMKRLGRKNIEVIIKQESLAKAQKWEDKTYAEQKKYLEDHPNTERKITATPPGEEGEEDEEYTNINPEQLQSLLEVSDDMIEETIDDLEDIKSSIRLKSFDIEDANQKIAMRNDIKAINEVLYELEIKNNPHMDTFEALELTEPTGDMVLTFREMALDVNGQWKNREEDEVSFGYFTGSILEIDDFYMKDIHEFFRRAEVGYNYIDKDISFNDLNDKDIEEMKNDFIDYMMDIHSADAIYVKNEDKLIGDHVPEQPVYDISDTNTIINELLKETTGDIDDTSAFFEVVGKLTALYKNSEQDIAEVVNDKQHIDNMTPEERHVWASVAFNMGYYSNYNPVSIYTEPLKLEPGRVLYHGTKKRHLYSILNSGVLGSKEGYAKKYQSSLDDTIDFGSGEYVWTTTRQETANSYGDIVINLSNKVTEETEILLDNDIYGKDSKLNLEHSQQQFFSKGIDLDNMVSISLPDVDMEIDKYDLDVITEFIEDPTVSELEEYDGLDKDEILEDLINELGAKQIFFIEEFLNEKRGN